MRVVRIGRLVRDPHEDLVTAVLGTVLSSAAPRPRFAPTGAGRRVMCCDRTAIDVRRDAGARPDDERTGAEDPGS